MPLNAIHIQRRRRCSLKKFGHENLLCLTLPIHVEMQSRRKSEEYILSPPDVGQKQDADAITHRIDPNIRLKISEHSDFLKEVRQILYPNVFGQVYGSAHGMRNEMHFRLKWLHRTVQCSRFCLATDQKYLVLMETRGRRRTVSSHFTDEVKLVAHPVGIATFCSYNGYFQQPTYN
jgi:hypothetical protein